MYAPRCTARLWPAEGVGPLVRGSPSTCQLLSLYSRWPLALYHIFLFVLHGSSAMARVRLTGFSCFHQYAALTGGPHGFSVQLVWVLCAEVSIPVLPSFPPPHPAACPLPAAWRLSPLARLAAPLPVVQCVQSLHSSLRRMSLVPSPSPLLALSRSPACLPAWLPPPLLKVSIN